MPNSRVLVELCYISVLMEYFIAVVNVEIHSLTWKDVHNIMCEKSLVTAVYTLV